ncbi:MAG: iron ABC transporter permease [Corynebacterium sp.]|nr:iron ABC transporter permease [Corynebacterium sp.]
MAKTRAGIALLCLGLSALCAISLVISLRFGSVSYSTSQVWEVVKAHITGDSSPDSSVENVVWQLRFPRGLLAAIVGAGLALAGVMMQTLVRNPLADPYLLGISSGASVGATAVITFGALSGFGIYALSAGALLGAILATTAVYGVTMAQGGITPLRLILSGVVLSAAFSAIASFLVFRGPDARAAQSVMFWMLGSVSGAQWDKLALPLLVVFSTMAIMLALAAPCDALATGEDTATSLGLRVNWLRQALFFMQAALVGVMVAVAGGIGFVGLVVPHIARIIVGSQHTRLIPVAMLCGAVFLIWVDVVARVAAPPQEVPLGVVTGLVGAPLFLILMGRKNYVFGGQQS